MNPLAAGSLVVLGAGGAMFGLAWFAQPVSVPRWILLFFLLVPVGDVQQIVDALSDRVLGRLETDRETDEKP